jgi:uncharacterized phage-associated protein
MRVGVADLVWPLEKIANLASWTHIGEMKPWFKVRKAAQVGAYFAGREGGNINLLKLVKLIYLANRHAMAKFDYPLFDDVMVSMPHGPADSFVYNYINGAEPDRSDWEAFLADRANHMVGLANPGIGPEELDELSDADVGILSQTWDKFGQMDEWQLVEHTHEHCPEWEDPNGSSYAIPYELVFRILGKQNSEQLEEMIHQRRRIETALAV